MAVLMIKPNIEKLSVSLIGAIIAMSNLLAGFYSIPFGKTIGWLFMASLGLLVTLRKGVLRLQPSYFWLLFIFLIWLIIGVMYSNASGYGVWKVVMVAGFWIVIGFFLFRLGLISGLIDSLLIGMLIGTGVSLVFIVYNLGLSFFIINEVSSFYRLRIGDSNPIVISQHLGIGVIIVFGFLFRSSSFQLLHVLGASLFVILLLSYMFLTGSKGPFIALIFAVATLLWFTMLKQQKWIILIILSLLSLSIYFLLTKTSEHFILQRYVITANSGSIESRFYIILMALSSTFTTDTSRLLFGTGTGNFGYIYSGNDQRMYPHNIIAEILCENGIIGTVILITILVYPLMELFKFTKKYSISIISDTGECIPIVTAIYIYSIINAQVTGDIGSNFYIGIFGWIILAFLQLVSLHKR